MFISCPIRSTYQCYNVRKTNYHSHPKPLQRKLSINYNIPKYPINTATTRALQKNPTHTKSQPTRNPTMILRSVLCGKSWVLTCPVAGLWMKPDPTQELSVQKQPLHVSWKTVSIRLLFLSLLSCYLETMHCHSMSAPVLQHWYAPTGIFTAVFFISIRGSWIEACANTVCHVLSEKLPSLLTHE